MMPRRVGSDSAAVAACFEAGKGNDTGLQFGMDRYHSRLSSIALSPNPPSEEATAVKGGGKGVLKKSALKPISVGYWATMPGQSVVAEAADDRTSGPVP